MIDRKKFFDRIRETIFNGHLKQDTVKGVEAILDEWERRGLVDLRYLAYMLATARGEVGVNMLPVREGFKSTDAEARAYVKSKGYKYAAEVNGHVYYGRGLVQLTWHENYKKMGDILDIELDDKPDLALEPKVASAIMFTGMILGTFTGKKLSDYFNEHTTDWDMARSIVNGRRKGEALPDRAKEFGAWGKQFYNALLFADTAVDIKPKPPAAPDKPPPPPAKEDEPKVSDPPGFWQKFANLFRPQA